MTVRAAFVLLSVLLVSCSQRKPGDPLRPGFNTFSVEQDIQLGREAAAQARQQLPLVDDAVLESYIDRLGTAVTRHPDAGKFPYDFTWVNDKTINAFALPGGPVFMNTGTLLNADNESQFVGVLAHEAAHIALRHGTNQASKATLIQLPAMIAGAAVGSNSVLGQLAQLGIGIGANSVLLKYSRDAEREADALGARFMAAAGYNPIEMARFFEKLEAQGGSRGPEFFSSHPSPGNRVELVQAEIRLILQREFNSDSGQFREARARAEKLPAPSKPSQGLRSNLAPPTMASGGSLHSVNTRLYTLSVPQGWELFGDANKGAVTVAPREGLVKTVGGGVAIGYGIVASYYEPQGGIRNLAAGTTDLLRQLEATNPGIRATGRQRRARVGGSAAIVTTLNNESPFNGVPETDYLVTVARPEGLFYMLFIAPSREMPRLEPLFEQVLASVSFRQ